MTDRVSNLHVLPTKPKVPDQLIQRLQLFVADDLIELDGMDEMQQQGLIDLDSASGDEKLLGELNPFEKQCFTLAKLVEESIKETLQEAETTATEAMAKYMRETKVPLFEAMKHQMQHMPEDFRQDMNKRAITHTTLIHNYEWSVRQRFDQWSNYLIVRRGFTVYHHG